MRTPNARRGDVVDTFYGTDVPDPYRWLEDPDAPETRSWIDANNAVTEAFLAEVPARDALRARLRELVNYERTSAPYKEGGRYFWYRNDGLQNHAVLYVGDDPGSSGTVLLDPNTLSADGTTAVDSVAISEDGARLAYGLADGGSDWRTLCVRDVATGADLPDRIAWVKFSTPTWTPDAAGFFYARYPAPENPLEAVNRDQQLFYHRLGTPQADDRLVYARPDAPDWGFATSISEDGELLVVSIWQGSEKKNRIHVADLRDPRWEVRPLFDAFDGAYAVIGKVGRTLWVWTDAGASRGRVFKVDLDRPDTQVDVIPEGEDTLTAASLVGGVLITVSLRHAHTVVHRYTLDGAPLGEVALPGIGTASGFGGRQDDPETFYTFTGYTRPATVYRLDAATGESALWRAPKLVFDPDDYETHQIFVPSADGTRIPVFLVHRAGLVRDGSHPTVLYGYGGFNIPLTPGYSSERLLWLQLGGVAAVACLRGGGEYGREWHDAGTKLRKQNVFDDFVAVAEHLVAERYTSPGKLVSQGRSNGGLLVGATLLQRPDLFGAALPAVGVHDMLRYHKFTIGWAWAADYGTPEESEEMFRALLAYSPVHNARPGRYPAVLVTTGDHDDRVVPAHSFKFAAALQAAQQGDAPVLIRVETRAGHGALTPLAFWIDEVTDQMAFLARALAIPVPFTP